MAKAKQLPSGSWRVQVYTGRNANGKAQYISITCDTEDEANYAALTYKLGRANEVKNPENYTVGEAIDNYLDARDAILSPSTIREYRQVRRNALPGIMDVRIGKLTQEMVQREINRASKTYAPKTVRNMHGVLTAILREYRPGFNLHTKLPQKTKKKMFIPSMQVVKSILEAAKGTEIEVPILLAVCLGLRRSEILGLKWSDIDFKRKTVDINCAVVLDENNVPVEKNPKSYAGNRTLPMPEILVQALWEYPRVRGSDSVIHITGSTLYKRFQTMLAKNNIAPMRLHDLRHVNASVMLALNIPNKYAAERMGHASEDMLKTVYQHTISKEADDINKIVNEFFDTTLK